MFITTKEKLQEFVYRTQRNFCQYDSFSHGVKDSKPPSFCDCKYGAELPNDGPSEQTGCPELRCVSEILKHMTYEEYTMIMRRGGHI